MQISPDVTIVKTVSEVLIELDGKIDKVEQRLTRKIEAVDAKVDRVKEELTAEIKAVDAKVDRVKEELTAEIRAVDTRLTGQIQVVQENQQYISGQLKGISSQINLLTVLITILIGIAALSAVIIPFAQKIFTALSSRPQSLNLTDTTGSTSADSGASLK